MSLSHYEPDFPSALDAADPTRYSLPDTMSGLLATAISDARSLNPKLYHPDSDNWHHASNNGFCSVCLAGSVIARTFKAPRHRTFNPIFFGHKNCHKFDALDSMRKGAWFNAYYDFYQRPAAPAIAKLLNSLPEPSNTHFTGWHAFRSHLDSLEAILPELRKIEANESRM